MVQLTRLKKLTDKSVFSQWKKGDLITFKKYGYGNQKKILVNIADNK